MIVLETKGYVRDPVLDRANIVSGDRLQVFRFRFRGVNEVAVAALYGEAIRQSYKTRDDLTNWCVDVLDSEVCQDKFPVTLESRIIDELRERREGFHFSFP